VEAAPVPTVAAVNPALALTLKLENVSPPKSHPAAGRSMTLLTLTQLIAIASARGGVTAQLTARRAREGQRREEKRLLAHWEPPSPPLLAATGAIPSEQPACQKIGDDISFG